MIKSASLGKELEITIKNKIGVLADISKILSDRGINIDSVVGYVVDGSAKLMLVTGDDVRAKETLEKTGYKPIKENEVILAVLENKPGALKSITAKLASANIDIKYTYGTTCPTGCPATIVLSTSSNEKALVALKK